MRISQILKRQWFALISLILAFVLSASISWPLRGCAEETPSEARQETEGSFAVPAEPVQVPFEEPSEEPNIVSSQSPAEEEALQQGDAATADADVIEESPAEAPALQSDEEDEKNAVSEQQQKDGGSAVESLPPAPDVESEERASDPPQIAATEEDGEQEEDMQSAADETSAEEPLEEDPEDMALTTAESSAAAISGSCITSLIVSPSEVENYGKVRVEVAFSDGSPGEHVFHGGDSIDISWPTEGSAILKGYKTRIPLVNEEGITYGEVHVTSGGATITFNNNVNDMYDVNGSFFFDVMATNNSDTTEEDTQIATIVAGARQANVAIHKAATGAVEGGDSPDFRKQADDIGGGYAFVEGSGWMMSLNPDDPTYTQWILTANENEQPIASDITIQDTIGEGQRLDRSYLLVYSTGKNTSTLSGTVDSVTAAWNSAHPGSRLSFNAGGDLSWKIDQATADGTYWCMVYRCQITDFSRTYFENSATVKWISPDGTSFSAHDRAMFSNVEQGGEVHGLPRGVLQVEKTVSGTEVKVPGVTFAVQRQDGAEWVTVGVMTTDESGSATLSKLKTGHYRLYETQTPAYLIPRYTADAPYEFDLDLNSPLMQSLALNVENAVRRISVEAEKRWTGADGSIDTGDHPTIWLQLYRKTPSQARAVAVGGPVRLSSGQTRASWSDLPAYDVHGREYVYFVRETDELGRDWIPEGYAKAEEGLVVINTKDATIDIPVTKTWEDGNDQDGLRPQSVVVHLLANGEQAATATIVPDGLGEWTYRFTGLPKYRGGAEIVYTVAEEPVRGYRANVDGFRIVNEHTPETIDIPVTKTWEDGNDQDGLRPQSVVVHLLANGEQVATATIVPDGLGEWTYCFTGLPKYRDGAEIAYALSEADVENYSSLVDGYTLTNQYTPGRTAVHIEKIWEDQNDQDGLRPERIQVQLLADGKAAGPLVTLSDETGWGHTWTDLPVKANGRSVAYSIEEVAVEGYTSELSGSAGAGYILTNRHTPETIDIPVTKTWEDGNDRDGLRPQSIVVHLLANGEQVRSLTIESDAQGCWTGQFTDLPRFSGGKEIVYTVVEAPVAGYESIVEGNNITNRIRIRRRVAHDQVSVSKTDIHGNGLEGAQFALYVDGDETREIKTCLGGRFSIGTADEALAAYLPQPGESATFYLRETKAPQGYMLSDQQMRIVVTAAKRFAISGDDVFEDLTAYEMTIDGKKSATIENQKIPSPVAISLGAEKRLEGKSLSENMFSFELLDERGNVLQTAQNGKEGHIAFQPIRYDREGVYTYTIREVSSSMTGMTYDKAEYRVIVTVTARDEKLIAVADKAPDAIVFQNKYSPRTPGRHGHTSTIPKTGYGPDGHGWMALVDILALVFLLLLVKREHDA